MGVMINFGKNELKVYIIEWFSNWRNMKRKQTERFYGRLVILCWGRIIEKTERTFLEKNRVVCCWFLCHC